MSHCDCPHERPSERRRDPDSGRIWQLVHGAFRRWDGREVVVATQGWEHDGQVRRDLHIDADDWRRWAVVDG
ncbi:MAG: hypothetical protein ACRDPM_20155 [Solirubrobacteraceae bacterium]